VSCAANLLVRAGGDKNTEATHAIDYDIRTSLTPGEQFVLHSSADRWTEEYQDAVLELAADDAVHRLYP